MPEVSVVIPSYNHAPYVADAVRSVLAQTVTDLELIVVDDGSTDESLEILRSFSDPRVQVISQANRGAHAAINRGLAEASGQFLAILNSDDEYHPQRLEKLIPVLKADPRIGLVGSYIEVVDRDGRVLGVKRGYQNLEPWPLEVPERSFRASGDLRATLLTENYWSTTSNYVFRREWYQRVGEFRTLRYTHDWDFALRVARVALLSLLPEPLMRYRVHPTNTIREDQAAMIFEICWILAVHLPEHTADAWFLASPLEHRVDQLLHSIHTLGCDRVLSVMLVQKLSENVGLALKLLDLDDPIRAKYLDFIVRQLVAQANSETTLEGRASPRDGEIGEVLVNRLRQISSRIRALVRR